MERLGCFVLLFTWLGDLFIDVEFIDFTIVDFVLHR